MSRDLLLDTLVVEALENFAFIDVMPQDAPAETPEMKVCSVDIIAPIIATIRVAAPECMLRDVVQCIGAGMIDEGDEGAQTDALGEIANLLAGRYAAQRGEDGASVTLGLPNHHAHIDATKSYHYLTPCQSTMMVEFAALSD